MPSNAQNGKYQVKCEGILDTEAGGYVFYNVTDIPFDAKQASVFIQLSRPIYKQGQSGKHASLCGYYMYRKVPHFRMPENFAVIYLNFKQRSRILDISSKR